MVVPVRGVTGQNDVERRRSRLPSSAPPSLRPSHPVLVAGSSQARGVSTPHDLAGHRIGQQPVPARYSHYILPSSAKAGAASIVSTRARVSARLSWLAMSPAVSARSMPPSLIAAASRRPAPARSTRTGMHAPPQQRPSVDRTTVRTDKAARQTARRDRSGARVWQHEVDALSSVRGGRMRSIRSM